jgi:hypothetical protein
VAEERERRSPHAVFGTLVNMAVVKSAAAHGEHYDTVRPNTRHTAPQKISQVEIPQP